MKKGIGSIIRRKYKSCKSQLLWDVITHNAMKILVLWSFVFLRTEIGILQTVTAHLAELENAIHTGQMSERGQVSSRAASVVVAVCVWCLIAECGGF